MTDRKRNWAALTCFSFMSDGSLAFGLSWLGVFCVLLGVLLLNGMFRASARKAYRFSWDEMQRPVDEWMSSDQIYPWSVAFNFQHPVIPRAWQVLTLVILTGVFTGHVIEGADRFELLLVFFGVVVKFLLWAMYFANGLLDGAQDWMDERKRLIDDAPDGKAPYPKTLAADMPHPNYPPMWGEK